MDKLTKALEACLSGDPSRMQPAEKWLNEMEKANLPQFLKSLSDQMLNNSARSDVRQLAATRLKNTFVSRDAKKRDMLERQWRLLPAKVREGLKTQLLQCLAVPERKVRDAAAQAVSRVAAIEIPNQMWSGLPKQLCQIIVDAKTSVALKESCVTTLGYVCEDCPEQLIKGSSMILSAISKGMVKTQTDDNFKLKSTRALESAIPLSKQNFEVKQQRTLILSMIFAAASTRNSEVQEAAMRCLVAVAEYHYEHLGEFMQPIFNLTSNAIKQAGDRIAMQAVEFWSQVCEVELDIMNEIEDTGNSERRSFNFIKRAKDKVIPMMLASLLKQSEDLDEFFDRDKMDVSKAAAICMSLLAQVLKNDIVPLTFPFIKTNIGNPNWRNKEAATMAFAQILEGPERKVLMPIVKKAFPLLLNMMKDQSRVTQDSAAWTIGKICEELPEVIDDKLLPELMRALKFGLGYNPSTAEHVCWAIRTLAEKVQIQGNTSPLSKYFTTFVTDLLKVTRRTDGTGMLATAAYNTIVTLINGAAPDTYQFVIKLLPEYIKRLQVTFSRSDYGGASDTSVQEQSLICASLQALMRRVPRQCAPHMDKIMGGLVRVLQDPQAGGAHHDAVLALSDAVAVAGENFGKYMGKTMPLLVRSIKDHSSFEVCSAAAGTIGDIARTMEGKIGPFCNDIIKELLNCLAAENLSTSVKPRVIDCIGDMALATNGNFTPYLPHVMRFLQSAAATNIPVNERDDEDIENLNSLRLSLLTAFESIIEGLGTANQAGLMLKYSDGLLKFLIFLVRDKDSDSEVVGMANSVLAVIANLMGPLNQQLKGVLLSNVHVQNIVKRGLMDKTPDTAQRASRAREAVIGLKTSG